jgi:hypothetical protein
MRTVHAMLGFLMGVALAAVLSACAMMFWEREPHATQATPVRDCGPVRFDPLWLRLRGLGQTASADGAAQAEGIPSIEPRKSLWSFPSGQQD